MGVTMKFIKNIIQYITLRHLSRVRDLAMYTRYGAAGVHMLQRRDYDKLRGEFTKFKEKDLVKISNDPVTVWEILWLDGEKGKIGYAGLIRSETGVIYKCKKPIGFINHI